MRHYRHGAHTKTDLKAHVVWIPKYRKKLLIGPVAVRVRDLIRQIAMEHELHIISGKVARDHVHCAPQKVDPALIARFRPCAFYLFIHQPMGRKSALRREIPWILRGFQGRLSC